MRCRKKAKRNLKILCGIFGLCAVSSKIKKNNKNIEFTDFLNDFQLTEQVYDGYIYHYTSSEATKNILENRELRFVDRYYLNDYSEGRYSIELTLKHLNELIKNKKQNKEFYKIIKEELEDRKKNLQNNHFYVYQCSFSINKDSLPLWNYYARDNSIKGYNLKFRADKLKKSVAANFNGVNIRNVYAGKVVYKKAKQLQIIREILKKFEKYYENNKNSVDLKTLANYAVKKIYQQGAFFKNECFAAEEEYRIILILHGAKGVIRPTNEKLKFIERNGQYIPYVNRKFDITTLEGIRMSPTLNEKETRESLYSICKIYYPKLKKENIKKSEIPVRY